MQPEESKHTLVSMCHGKREVSVNVTQLQEKVHIQILHHKLTVRRPHITRRKSAHKHNTSPENSAYIIPPDKGVSHN